MTAEREIDYEALAQSAMRGIVRTVLVRVAKTGLPGEHHFYVAFKTDSPGVILSKRLKEKYPEEMTVVLQHRFWDLIVTEERFEVKLTFDNVPERLVVPFAAIKVFFDPSVPYGLQFDEGDGDSEGQSAHQLSVPRADAGGDEPNKPATVSATSRTEKKPRAPRRLQSDKPAERPATGDKTTDKPTADKTPSKISSTKSSEADPPATPKVVSIDAFRKK
jgi:uncharacterized protein